MNYHKKRWVIISVIILIVSNILEVFFQPVIFKKNYIERIIKTDLPRETKILDYRFGISSYGYEPFYAKMYISQDTYNFWKERREFFGIDTDNNYAQETLKYLIEIKNEYDYISLVLDDAEEVLFKELIRSRGYFWTGISTRVIYSFIIKEDNYHYYLYVLY